MCRMHLSQFHSTTTHTPTHTPPRPHKHVHITPLDNTPSSHTVGVSMSDDEWPPLASDGTNTSTSLHASFSTPPHHTHTPSDDTHTQDENTHPIQTHSDAADHTADNGATDEVLADSVPSNVIHHSHSSAVSDSSTALDESSQHALSHHTSPIQQHTPHHHSDTHHTHISSSIPSSMQGVSARGGQSSSVFETNDGEREEEYQRIRQDKQNMEKEIKVRTHILGRMPFDHDCDCCN